MTFDEYVMAQGYPAGKPIRSAVAKQLHAAWLKEQGGGWKPTSVAVTNAVTGAVEPALFTSPNSATLMNERQPQLKPVVGKDGKAYNFNPATGEYSPAKIAGTTNYFEPASKQPAFGEFLDSMNQQQDAASQPGLIERAIGFFAGGEKPSAPPRGVTGAVQAQPPTNAPAPAQAAPTPAPAPSPAPAAAPPATPEAVREAWVAGKISQEDAVRMLRGTR